MLHLINPFSSSFCKAYRERLNETVKFIVSGASDEFFLTDDSHYFFHDLPGPKYMMLLENAGHAMFPHYLDILEAVGAIIKPVFKVFCLIQIVL